MKSISSPDNAEFKEALKLTESSGIKKQKKYILSGKKIVSEVIKNKLAKEGSWWISEDHLETEFVLKSKWPIRILSKKLFNDLDVLGSGSPLLELPLPLISAYESQKPEGATLILATQDPQNLGAILRSACAFGVTKVILLRECANPFLPKALKAASGATFYFDFFSGPSIKELNLNLIWALDMEGTPLKQCVPTLPKDFYLLAGEEGQGLPAIKNLKRISIPTQKVESLNVGVAVSLFLYEWSNQWKK